MRGTKNSISIILMLSSVFLLFVLQIFWLKGAYNDAVDNFRKETNSLFRSTVLAMHDSLIQRSIMPVAGDSSFPTPRVRRFEIHDSVYFNDGHLPLRDSILNYMNVTGKNARVEIFVSGNNKDSVQRILRPLARRMQMEKRPRKFILKLGPDSLNSDSIKLHYKQALVEAGINVPFKILAVKNQPGERFGRKLTNAKEVFTSEIVRVNPINQYAVSFMGIEGLLLKAITPQILFSLFLTLLTLTSFYLMFRTLRSQQRLMQIKNDFISNVTHELKTPVATMSVALEALKNFHALDNPQRTTEYLEIAQSELNRLTLMTDKILKTAVYEDKGVELKLEKINLDLLTWEILSSLKLVFDKRRIQISYQKTGSDFTLDASKEHLSNVLYNLLDNALKYSNNNSSVKVSIAEDSNKIILSIKDHGIGIAREYQKKIFEKFFRVPTGDVHNSKGYGLGLSYVASVVKSHRGEIDVESEPNSGSCFTITLPKRLGHRLYEN